MFKLPITFTGFDGKEKTRDFYFNLTKAELAKIHMSLPGGFDGFLERLNDDPEVEDIVNVFEKIILKSYGKRTIDGKFIKSKELSEEFSATDAYSELFIKFLDNEDDFVNKFLEATINVPAGSLQKAIEEGKKDIKAEEIENIDSSGDF